MSVLTGPTPRPPTGVVDPNAERLRRAGGAALAVVAACWVVIAALILRHGIFVTHDSLISYAHAWWIESQLWHGFGIPWRMPMLGSGEALTFPYGALPWLVASLLWPVLGEWAVTVVLVLGAGGLIAATFWAFPESRRPWWAVVVLANPILVLAPLSGQIPFLWAASLLVLAIGCWRRGHPGWATVLAGAAQLSHAAVVLPLAALVVVLRLRWEPRRRLLLACYLLSVLIAVPAIYPIVSSPVFAESSFATKAFQLTGTVLIRACVLLPPVLAALYAGRARPWLAPALAALALALNVALLAPMDARFSWAALDRTPDQAMTRFVATSEFQPGATYRVLYTADGKVGMYELMRHGATLDSEFFPESIWYGRFAGQRAYSAFLASRHVDYVLFFQKLPRTIRTNEGELLMAMASSGRSCSSDTVGVRLVAAHPGWDDYAIDFSCLHPRAGAAGARSSG